MRAESVEKWSRGQLVPGTPYEILGLIGVGGMGTVYEVLHRELGRRFVLKLLHERLAARSDLGSRMKNEWTALAGLSHPNIVQVTDAGYAPGGLPYYVMEKLEGSTVGQLLRERGRLSVGLAARITLDVLSGLAAAHERGVIHRDIKPQNVFVLLDGRAKVLDFGIAQMSAQAARVVTAAGVAVGTPRYMAPEQAEGRRVDGRADIYAVALVLYEMLLGRGPFAEIRDPNQLVMAHIARTPERIERLAPELPVELSDLLQRWLSKLPDERPWSALAARRELSSLEGLLSFASPDTDEVTLEAAYEAPTVGPESGPVLRAELVGQGSEQRRAEEKCGESSAPTVVRAAVAQAPVAQAPIAQGPIAPGPIAPGPIAQGPVQNPSSRPAPLRDATDAVDGSASTQTWRHEAPRADSESNPTPSPPPLARSTSAPPVWASDVRGRVRRANWQTVGIALGAMLAVVVVGTLVLGRSAWSGRQSVAARPTQSAQLAPPTPQVVSTSAPSASPPPASGEAVGPSPTQLTSAPAAQDSNDIVAAAAPQPAEAPAAPRPAPRSPASASPASARPTPSEQAPRSQPVRSQPARNSQPARSSTLSLPASGL